MKTDASTSARPDFLVFTNFTSGNKPIQVGLALTLTSPILAWAQVPAAGTTIMLAGGERLDIDAWESELEMRLETAGFTLDRVDGRDPTYKASLQSYRETVLGWAKREPTADANDSPFGRDKRETQPADTDRVGPGETCSSCDGNFEETHTIVIDDKPTRFCSDCLATYEAETAASNADARS